MNVKGSYYSLSNITRTKQKEIYEIEPPPQLRYHIPSHTILHLIPPSLRLLPTLLPRALLLQPLPKSLHPRMQPPNLRQIRPIPDLLEPPKHIPHLLDQRIDNAHDEPKRSGQLLARLLLVDLLELVVRQLVAGQGQRIVLPLRGLRLQEGLGGEVPDVAGGDELQLLGARERHVEVGVEHLAQEPRDEVLHEGDGPQHRVRHIAALGFGEQVRFHVELGDEVRHVRLVARAALRAAAVDAAVDEVSHARGETRVHERLALRLFRLGRGFAAEGRLYGEDAPDGGGG